MLLQGYTDNTYATKSLDMEIGMYHPFLYSCIDICATVYNSILHPNPVFLQERKEGTGDMC